MANDVKVLKLITGEELITRMTESDINITDSDEVDILILEKPMTLSVIADVKGKLDIGMRQWVLAGYSDKITIEIKHILVILDPVPQMEKEYLSRITGLTL